MSTAHDSLDACNAVDAFERQYIAARGGNPQCDGHGQFPLSPVPRTAAAEEVWFRAALELAPDGIVITDARGRITFANQQIEALFGYARDTLLGQPIETLVPAGFRRAHRAKRAAFMAAPRTRPMGKDRQLFGRRADGSEFPVDVALAPVAVAGVTRFVATYRDATARLQQEQQLREQSELLTRTFDAKTEAVYVYDRSGQILRMNPAARAFGGYDARPQPAARPPEERLAAFQPRDAQGNPLPPEAWPVSRVLRGETLPAASPAELLTTSPTGREQVISVTGAPLRDADGAIMGAVVVSREVTEQRRLESELTARAQEIESIFETSADAIMLFDTEGRALRMNAAQRRLLGYEATGRTDFLSPEERASWFPVADAQGNPLPQEAWPMYRVLRGETLTGEHVVEMRLRTLDGRMILVNMSGAPVRDATGRIVGGVTAARDVTAQRLAERQRTDILRTVAHDMANQIAGVSLYLASKRFSIERGQPPRPPDEELEVLEAMAGEMMRMQRLVDDMRVVFVLEAQEFSLELRPCDLAALCRQEARAMQAATGHAVRVELPPGPVLVSADPDRLGQVVTNLLSNADKYSPLERPITLTLQVEALGSANMHQGSPQRTTMPGAVDGMVTQQARVLIRDAGLGIPPQEQPHLWERFHRVVGNHARSGTGGSLGFGLYICHELIERQGGAIGVESAPGKGSTFWFTLPLATEGQP